MPSAFSSVWQLFQSCSFRRFPTIANHNCISLYCTAAQQSNNQKQKSSMGFLRYGTELFSALDSSKNIPYRNFVLRKNTVRKNTIRNFFRTVIPYLSVPHFFNQFTSRKIQQETFAIATSKFRFIGLLF